MMELSKRDKTVLTALVVFLIIFSMFQFIYFPATDKRDLLLRTYAAQDDAIAQMTQLSKNYQDVSQKLDKQNVFLEKRAKNFTLFSFLDVLAQKSGIKKNVAYMKPVSQDLENENYKLSKVRVKLVNVYLKGLIDFLSLIESSTNGVVITSLSLNKTGKNADMLDAVIETQTLELKGNG